MARKKTVKKKKAVTKRKAGGKVVGKASDAMDEAKARALLDAQMQERAKACEADVRAALEKHGCVLQARPVPVQSPGPHIVAFAAEPIIVPVRKVDDKERK